MDQEITNDSSLQILRIEKSRSQTVFLYFKRYPVQPSSKFDPERTLIFFYFEPSQVNESFLKEYFSNVIGEIKSLSFGKYLNKKGSKAKRRLTYFSIITFE